MKRGILMGVVLVGLASSAGAQEPARVEIKPKGSSLVSSDKRIPRSTGDCLNQKLNSLQGGGPSVVQDPNGKSPIHIGPPRGKPTSDLWASQPAEMR